VAPKAPGSRSAPEEVFSIYSPFNLISDPRAAKRAFGPAWRAFPITLNRWRFLKRNQDFKNKIKFWTDVDSQEANIVQHSDVAVLTQPT